MKYYEIYDVATGGLICKGTSRECKEIMGSSSMDTFYALVNRSRRGINKSYTVVIKKGGEVAYPVLGPKTPKQYTERNDKE